MTDIDRMLHPDEARSIVLSRTTPLGSESVPLTEAGGRLLSRSLVATQSLPPFRASTMDGFAVIHDDPAEELVMLPGGLAGGEIQKEVVAGQAAKIMTGAPVPNGADAVVPIENTVVSNGHVRISQPSVSAGDNIRPIGSDMVKGEEILAAGIRLTPPDLGLLASLGHAQVEVGKRPKVAVFSTGDEVVAPDVEPGPGQIRDSNRFSLAYAAESAGAEVVINRHVPDAESDLRTAFSEALEVADVIVTSGGVSMGDRDLVKALLGEFAEVHFRRVFMKPGKPLNFATTGNTLIFGLPTIPVSCLVSFQYSPFHGLHDPPGRSRHRASSDPSLSKKMSVPPTGSKFSARYRRRELTGVWQRVTGCSLSATALRLQSFVGSNGFLVVPPSEQRRYLHSSVLEAIHHRTAVSSPRLISSLPSLFSMRFHNSYEQSHASSLLLHSGQSSTAHDSSFTM
ncbi:MAG: molybdopterin molybdotransferase MoeA [Thermomicrobiales bacterium]